MTASATSQWLDIGAVEAFSEDTPVAVHAGGMQIAIFRLEDQLFALHDLCTHGVARLSEGYVENGCVECPLHQGLFDIRTGAPQCAPVTEAVRSFPIRIHDGRVELALDAQAPATAEPAAAIAATVVALRKAASDVAILSLQLPETAEVQYVPGQYMDVLVGTQRRSYSVAAIEAHTLTLHIRHLPGGLFTDQLFGTPTSAPAIHIGATLMMDGAHGQFQLQSGDRPKIMLATGTGFAPIHAMMLALIARANQAPVYFYWGGRQLSDLYQHALCLSWATRFPWFHYIPVLSQPAKAETAVRTGYVTHALLADWSDLSPFEVYACGSPAMVSSAQALCLQHGLPLQTFFADAFLSQADQQKAA